MTRWVGRVASSTIGDGQVGVGPGGEQLGDVLRRAWPTPMSTTRVAAASRRRRGRGPSSVPWPWVTCTAPTVPRWVTGMPAAAGAASAELTPGTTSTGMPWAAQCRLLLAAAAEEERVAALEPDHDAAAPRLLDEDAR